MKVKQYHQEMTTVDFLIIGAQKSGTTSLRSFFNQNSSIFFLPKEELHFWNKAHQYRNGNGIPDYMAHFSQAQSGQLVGEKSPSYLPSLEAPERIAKHLPEIKLIAVLRNPTDRAYSAYLHGLRVGAIKPTETFSDVIRAYDSRKGRPFGDLVTQGIYFDHISNFLKYFDKNQLLIVDFDELTHNPEGALREVVEFLIPDDRKIEFPIHEIKYKFPKHNQARHSNYPQLVRWIRNLKFLSRSMKLKLVKKTFSQHEIKQMLPEDREFLNSLFSDANEKLYKLLDRDFNWATESNQQS